MTTSYPSFHEDPQPDTPPAYEGLNHDQQTAVLHTQGPLLVLAGAGSGKTRVVTQRIVHLIHSGVPYHAILGLTFTNKASQEMQERIRKASSAHVLIATFHKFGALILRESIGHLGFSEEFTIYDQDDSLKLIKECLTQFSLPSTKSYLKEAKGFISDAKNRLTSPQDTHPHGLSRVYELYQNKLKEYQALDFDDLLYLPVQLFRSCPDILAYYQQRFTHILIDEYQDTNEAQYTLMRLLVEKNHNICVVGDPDQSIYSWRGANLGNILRFEKDYPNTLVVRLEQNYRSTQTILSAANALISHNASRFEKDLWTDQGLGEKIHLYRASSDTQEAEFVAQKILELEKQQVPLDQMVIFYRTNAQSRSFEDRLLKFQIPYQIIGGLSFYQRREIKDVLAYLKMIDSDSDYVSFLRTINLPKRGIGKKTMETIRQEANLRALPIFRCLQQADLPLTSKPVKAIAEYVALIQSLRAFKGSLSELIVELIERMDYLAVLKEEEETMEDRMENISALIAKAQEWEEENPEKKLLDFLEELSLKGAIDDAQGGEATVSLMTIHHGKGLEYPVVFLVGMEENLFPHVNAQGCEDRMEEERRLAYVGLTRAQQLLYLTHARERRLYGSTQWMTPSRFIQEIPKQFVHKIS